MAPLVVLEPIARVQASVLANLFELYVHDFSEQVPIDLQPNGRFDLPLDERWWQTDDHFPFFFLVDGKLCGFALARRGSRVTAAIDVMDVAEFFVVRGARAKGVGASAARALLAAFPGRWEGRVRRGNVGAAKFWRRVAERCGVGVTVSVFSAKDVDWEVLSLGSTAPAIRGALRCPWAVVHRNYQRTGTSLLSVIRASFVTSLPPSTRVVATIMRSPGSPSSAPRS